MNSDSAWKLFKETGCIMYYLLYKRLEREKADKKTA